MCTQCKGKSRISGSKFRSKVKGNTMDAVGSSLGRGASAFLGFVGGEYVTNKLFSAKKANNQGLIGASKTLVSHVVAPFILPDSYMENEYVQSGLDGFGVSGVKDVVLAFSKDFVTKIGISGMVDDGYYPSRQATRINQGGNNATVPTSADLG
jgi:hypothetical protein